MRPTIYDVAEKAGVSIATVSKVINNTGKIGEHTKRQVFLVMEQINYQPSMIASAMMGKKMHTIGLLIPDIANPFFAELARKIEDSGEEKGYSVVMCNTDNDPEKEIQYLNWLKQKSVDGVIIATSAQEEETFKKLVKENLPFTLIARDLPSLPVDTVLLDDFLGGYLAGTHLVKCGCRNISTLTLNLNTSSETGRLEGFKQALTASGIKYNIGNVISCNGTVEDAYKKMKRFLNLKKDVDGLFALNDIIAIGAINSARDLHYNIPDDISIMGFDNTILATVSHPPLTSVAQPIENMGRQVVNLLIERIKENNKPKQRIVLSPELIIRETTKSGKYKT